jgi:hypothetical protein
MSDSWSCFDARDRPKPAFPNDLSSSASIPSQPLTRPSDVPLSALLCLTRHGPNDLKSCQQCSPRLFLACGPGRAHFFMIATFGKSPSSNSDLIALLKAHGLHIPNAHRTKRALSTVLGSSRDRKDIADAFNVGPNELESWLRALTYLCNMCAHQNRLLGVNFVQTPMASSKLPIGIRNTSFAAFVAVIHHLLREINRVTFGSRNSRTCSENTRVLTSTHCWDSRSVGHNGRFGDPKTRSSKPISLQNGQAMISSPRSLVPAKCAAIASSAFS